MGETGSNGGSKCPQGVETRVKLDNLIEDYRELREVVVAMDGRLRETERCVDRLTIRIGSWAAVGMIVGGLVIQAFTKYVLNW